MDRFSSYVIAGVALLISVASAFGQAEEGVPRAPEASPYATFGLVFLFAVLLLAVIFKPSKRGHQD